LSSIVQLNRIEEKKHLKHKSAANLGSNQFSR